MIRAFDLDGVLADFLNGHRDLVKEMFGLDTPEITESYPKFWDFDRELGLTEGQQETLWEAIRETDFWETLQPYPETAEVLTALKALRAAGDSIYFITARQGTYAKHLTEFWLDSFCFECPTVLIAPFKGAICRDLNVDVFVDDRIENCEHVLMASPKTQVFLLDRPYNRDGLTRRGIVRIWSLLDVRVIPAEGVEVAA